MTQTFSVHKWAILNITDTGHGLCANIIIIIIIDNSYIIDVEYYVIVIYIFITIKIQVAYLPASLRFLKLSVYWMYFCVAVFFIVVIIFL